MKTKLLKRKPKWAVKQTTGGWRWEEKETQFIEENICKLTPHEIAKRLGRSRNAINDRVYQMGLMPIGGKCQRPVKKAKNGKSRGTCSNMVGHHGQCHSETCAFCGKPAKTYKGTRRLCKACIAEKRKRKDPRRSSEYASRYYLKQAYKNIYSLSKKEGWMDSGIEEQKVRHDHIRPAQWFRAAEIFVLFNLKCRLRFALTNEDAIFDNRCRFVTFQKYAAELGLKSVWLGLIKKIKRIHKKVN